MTLDTISRNINVLEVEIAYLRSVYWQYKSGYATEEELRVAYNNFRSNVSWAIINDNKD